MIPPSAVERHLQIFPAHRWVVLAVDQGLQGVGGPPIHHPSRLDWARTAASLLPKLGVKVTVLP